MILSIVNKLWITFKEHIICATYPILSIFINKVILKKGLNVDIVDKTVVHKHFSQKEKFILLFFVDKLFKKGLIHIVHCI